MAHCRHCGGGWDYPCECDSNAQEAAEEATYRKLMKGDYDDEIEQDMLEEISDDEELPTIKITKDDREGWYEENQERVCKEWIESAAEEVADAKADAAEARAEMRREEGY